MTRWVTNMTIVALAGVLAGACGSDAPDAASASPPAAPAPVAPAVGSSPTASPPTAAPAPSPGGGSALLQEQMSAIAIQDTLRESQMQADAAAQASGQVAREQLRQIGADRTEQMDDVLESMDP